MAKIRIAELEQQLGIRPHLLKPTAAGDIGYTDISSRYDEGLIRDVNQQNMRGIRQNNFTALVNGVKQFPGIILGETLDFLGYTGALFQSGFDAEKFFSDEIDNWFLQAGESVKEAAGSEKAWLGAPVYVQQKNEGGFKPGNPEWWAQNIASIASSLSLMVPGFAVGKTTSFAIRNLAKAVKLGKKIDNLSDAGKAAWKGFTEVLPASLGSRYVENMMEATGTYDATYQEAIQSGKSEEDAHLIASEAAANNYKMGYAAMLTDITQYAQILGLRLPKGIRNTINKANKNKLFEIAGFAVNQMGGEAFEEALQVAISEEAKQAALEGRSFSVNGAYKVLKNSFNNPEAKTSMLFGAIGGGLFGAAGKGIENLSKKLTSNTPLTDQLRNVVENSNANQVIDELEEMAGETPELQEAAAEAASAIKTTDTEHKSLIAQGDPNAKEKAVKSGQLDFQTKRLDRLNKALETEFNNLNYLSKKEKGEEVELQLLRPGLNLLNKIEKYEKDNKTKFDINNKKHINDLFNKQLDYYAIDNKDEIPNLSSLQNKFTEALEAALEYRNILESKKQLEKPTKDFFESNEYKEYETNLDDSIDEYFIYNDTTKESYEKLTDKETVNKFIESQFPNLTDDKVKNKLVNDFIKQVNKKWNEINNITPEQKEAAIQQSGGPKEVANLVNDILAGNLSSDQILKLTPEQVTAALEVLKINNPNLTTKEDIANSYGKDLVVEKEVETLFEEELDDVLFEELDNIDYDGTSTVINTSDSTEVIQDEPSVVNPEPSELNNETAESLSSNSTTKNIPERFALWTWDVPWESIKLASAFENGKPIILNLTDNKATYKGKTYVIKPKSEKLWYTLYNEDGTPAKLSDFREADNLLLEDGAKYLDENTTNDNIGDELQIVIPDTKWNRSNRVNKDNLEIHIVHNGKSIQKVPSTNKSARQADKIIREAAWKQFTSGKKTGTVQLDKPLRISKINLGKFYKSKRRSLTERDKLGVVREVKGVNVLTIGDRTIPGFAGKLGSLWVEVRTQTGEVFQDRAFTKLFDEVMNTNYPAENLPTDVISYLMTSAGLDINSIMENNILNHWVLVKRLIEIPFNNPELYLKDKAVIQDLLHQLVAKYTRPDYKIGPILEDNLAAIYDNVEDWMQRNNIKNRAIHISANRLNDPAYRERMLPYIVTDLADAEYHYHSNSIDYELDISTDKFDDRVDNVETEDVDTGVDFNDDIDDDFVPGGFNLTKEPDNSITEVWDKKTSLEWFSKTFPNFPTRILNNLEQVGNKNAWGLFTDVAVYIAENAGKGTLYHEAFHVFFNLVLSDTQQARIINHAKRVYKKPTEYELKKYGTEARVYEERLADSFSEFIDKVKAPTSRLQKLFNDFWLLIKSIFSHKAAIQRQFTQLRDGKFESVVPNKFPKIKRWKLPDDWSPSYIQEKSYRLVEFMESRLRRHYKNKPNVSWTKRYQHLFKSVNVSEYIAKEIDIQVKKGFINAPVDSPIFKKFMVDLRNGVFEQEIKMAMYDRGIIFNRYNDSQNNQGEQDDTISTDDTNRESYQESIGQFSTKEYLNEDLVYMLNNIPVLNNDGAQIIDDFGFPVYHNFNKIFNIIQNTIGESTSVDEMMNRLSNYNWPETRQLADAINKSVQADRIKALLYHHIARKNRPRFITFLRVFDEKNRNYKYTTVSSDQDLLNKVILNDIKTTFRPSKAEEVLEYLKNNIATLTVEQLNNKLKEAGIQIPPTALQASKSNWKQLFIDNLGAFLTNPDFDKNQSAIESFVNELGPFYPITYQTAFFSVEGERRYSWINSSYAGETINKLANGTYDFDSLQTDPLLANLPVIKRMYRSFKKNDKNNYSYFVVDGIKSGRATSGNTPANMSEVELLTSLFSLFNPKGDASVAKDATVMIPFSVLSDSGQIAGIEIPMENGKSTQTLNTLLVQSIVAEQRRLKEAESIPYKNISEDHVLFPFANGIKLDLRIATNELEQLEIDAKNTKALQDAINKYLKEAVGTFKKPGELIKKLMELDMLGYYGNSVYLKNSPNIKNTNTESNLTNYLYDFVKYSLVYGSNINTLLAGDPAFYKDAPDWFKRVKQIWSPANKIVPGTKYKDIEVPATYKMKIFGKKTISGDDVKSKGVNSDNLLEAVDNTLNTGSKKSDAEESFTKVDKTDAQSYISLHAYRERMIGMGRWKGMDKQFELLMQGKWDSRFETVFQTLKPFYFGHFKRNGIRIPLQNKDSEAILFPVYANPQLINGKPNPIYNEDYKMMMEEMGYTFYGQGDKFTVTYNKENEQYNKATFPSSIKTGSLGDEILELNYSDWGLQVETPEHHIDYKGLLGTQIMKLIVSDIYDKGDYNGKSGNELIAKYNELLIRKIIINKEITFEELVDENGDLQMRKLSDILLNELNKRKLSDKYYEAVSLLDENNTVLPLYDPLIQAKVIPLLNSIFTKGINKMKMSSGVTLINQAPAGFKEPKIIFNEDKSIKYFEVYMPPHDKRFYKYADESGIVDIEKIIKYYDEKGNLLDTPIIVDQELAPLLEGILYRIPTEDKYSMFHVRVAGFLPIASSGSVIMPAEVTSIAGLDYDIDKMFGFFKTNEDSGIWEKQQIQAINNDYNIGKGLNKLFEEKNLHRANNDKKQLAIVNDKIAALIKERDAKITDIKTSKRAEREREILRIDNGIIDNMYDVLSSYYTLDKIIKPGGFERLKANNELLPEIEMSKDIFNPVNWARTFKRMMSGKALIGFAANYNIAHNLFQTASYKPTLSEPFKFNNYDYNQLGGAFEIIVPNKSLEDLQTEYKEVLDGKSSLDINSGKLMVNGLTIMFNGKPLHTFTDQLNLLYYIDTINNGNAVYTITQNIAEVLAAVVDNGKDPQADRFNLNIYTADVALSMLAAGVPLKTVQLFMGQPSIRRYANAMDNFDMVGYENYKPLSVFGELNWDSVSDTFTDQELLDNLANQVGEKEFNAKILRTFEIYRLRADKFSKVVGALKIPQNGLGPTLADSYVNINRYRFALREDKYISDIEQFATDTDRFLSVLFDQSMLAPNELLKQANLPDFTSNGYENLFTKIQNLKGNKPPSVKELNNVLINLSTYFGAGAEMYDHKEHEEVLSETPVLLANFKNNYSNAFIDKLQINKNNEIEFVGILGTDGREQRVLERAWKQMLANDEISTIKIQSGKPEIKWAKKAANNYEVSSKGDKRFSALYAKLKDGRTIEEAYQLDIKGYRQKGNDWKLGKGKPPINNITKEEQWLAYKDLWRTYLKENPELENDLRNKSAGKTLTDMFSNTEINQARALAELLNESTTTESITSISPRDMAIQLARYSFYHKGFEAGLKRYFQVMPIDFFKNMQITKIKNPISTSTSNIVYNEQQQNAIDDAVNFILNGNPDEYYVINGKAGTGKTTITQEIVKRVLSKKPMSVITGALTNVATNILKDKFTESGVPSRFKTLAGMTGRKPHPEDRNRFIDDPYAEKPISNSDLIIIDEASMVNEEIIENIYNNKPKNAKVLFLGDSGQLDPIRSEDDPYYINRKELLNKPSPVFNTKNMTVLTERVRQGEESPILPFADYYWENAHNENAVINPARERNNVITDKGALLFYNNIDQIIDQVIDIFKEAVENKQGNKVKIITYKNNTRTSLNELIHKRLFNTDYFTTGDIVMFQADYSKYKTDIKNGEQGIILNLNETIETDQYGVKYQEASVKLESGVIATVKIPVKEDINKYKQTVNQLYEIAETLSGSQRYEAFNTARAYLNNYAKIEYAYAITSHKAQGSTYEISIVDERDISSVIKTNNQNKSRSIYTGITRAQNLAIIISSQKVESQEHNLNAINNEIKQNRASIKYTPVEDIKQETYIERLENISTETSEHFLDQYIRNYPEKLTFLQEVELKESTNKELYSDDIKYYREYNPIIGKTIQKPVEYVKAEDKNKNILLLKYVPASGIYRPTYKLGKRTGKGITIKINPEFNPNAEIVLSHYNPIPTIEELTNIKNLIEQSKVDFVPEVIKTQCKI